MSKGLGTMCVAHVCVDPNDNNPDGGTSSTCTTNAQCGTGETPYCMNGSCVNMDLADRFICPADTTPMTSATINYKAKVLNYITRNPPAGSILVKACKNADVDCMAPVAMSEELDSMGIMTVDLPFGFLGFFKVTGDTVVESYVYVTKQLKQDTVDRDFQLLAPNDLSTLAAAAGTPIEASKGLALVEAFDCTGKSQGGVHFDESTKTATPFYIVNGVPTKSATISVYNPDTDVADGGFVNIQPGFVDFSARWGVDGPTIGSATVQIRAGTVSYIDMHF